MNVARFIAGRVAFNKHKSFSRFIIRLSALATIISVAVMIVTLSLVNGFQETVSNKVFSFLGHIRIQYRQPAKANISEEVPVEKNDSLVTEIMAIPGIHSVHPFATRYSILKNENEIEGVLVKGYDPSYDTLHLASFMQEGRFIHFEDSTYSREIVISSFMAEQLKLKINDRPVIYFIKPDGSIRPDRLTVTGIYKTGIEDYDKSFAIADLKLIQRLNSWQHNEIGGYEIFIDDYRQMTPLSEAIFALPAFPQLWDTKGIKEIYPEIFDWLNMQDTTRNLLIVFMVIVAVINLITCLIILVLERLRMIGTLKALGASDWTVQKVFLIHSVIITITGIAAGTALALGLLWLQQATGFIRLDEEAYYMSAAAVKIVWWQVALVAAGTFIISLLVLMIPSLIVKRIQPVKAIRFR
ncbi:MAG: FtsX-like permease family protein [Terrimonas sp.]|nr:FtsX-like permease family protein [Terrimonas sp.]